MKNQLLSIVFIDVQGYTKRTASQSREDNERFVKEIHEFVAQHLEKFEGKLVKTMGDGFMASFVSPSNAIQCSLDMQRKLESRNANVVNPNHYIRFRIGINTGEVSVDERGDLFGDAVNIAARIENFAESNEVFISEATYLAMNRSEFGTIDLGLQNFKNAAREIRVYKVSKSGVPPGTTFKGKPPTSMKVDTTASFYRRKSVGVIFVISIVLLGLVVLGKVWTGSRNRGDQMYSADVQHLDNSIESLNPLFQIKIDHIREMANQNHINEALNEFEELWKTIRKDESKISPMYLVGFGSLYLRDGKKEKADEFFSKALKKTQNDPAANETITRQIAEAIREKEIGGRGEIQPGAADIKTDYPIKTSTERPPIDSRRPDNIRETFNKASGSVHPPEIDARAPKSNFNPTDKERPNIDARLKHIEELKIQNRFPEAIKESEELISEVQKAGWNPPPDAYLDVGILHLRSGDEKSARESFERALLSVKDNPAAFDDIKNRIAAILQAAVANKH
ncbi:MAG: hypothetical protein HQM09_17245 [Candidatus Riflebacteria bacterium]|nr:hypothetical protein [Candidatus Riflebacteria bacterium]